MNARLYDPTIARFISADSIIPYMYDTQSFNRYSYVRNNPLKYIDPSGHFSLSSFVKSVGGALSKGAKDTGGGLSTTFKDTGGSIAYNKYKIAGAVLMIVGAIGIAFPPAWAFGGLYWGPVLMGAGATMIDYDPDEEESQQNQIYIGTGGSSGVPDFTVVEWGGSSQSQSEQEQYIVNNVSQGTHSVTTGNKLNNGADTNSFIVTIGDYSNVNGSGVGNNVLWVDRGESINIDYTSRVIGGIGGSLQVATGMMLCSSGYGCLLGIPLMAHGVNNIEEAYYGNGHRGVLRSNVYDNAFGSNSNYAYAVADVGLSASSMLRQVGVKSAQYWSRSFGNIERTGAVYHYQTMGGYSTVFEGVNNYNTISNIEGN